MFSLNLLNFRKQRNVISLNPKKVKIEDLKNFSNESENTVVSSVPNVATQRSKVLMVNVLHKIFNYALFILFYLLKRSANFDLYPTGSSVKVKIKAVSPLALTPNKFKV